MYSRKDKAVRALSEDNIFIQDTDYQFFPRNGENPKGGRPSGEYWLSIPCLEFFIARKRREVFEVYRQVFHKTIDQYAIGQAENRPAGQDTTLSYETAKVRLVKHIADMKISDADKTRLMEQLFKPETPIPIANTGRNAAGTEKENMLSATKLLNIYGSTIDVKIFNAVMTSIGYMKHEIRGRKTLNILIGEGLKYGENKVNRYYPSVTTPVYFEDFFGALLTIVIDNLPDN